MSHLRDLSFINAVEFLEGIGCDNISYGGDSQVYFSCPYPSHRFGDRSPSATMNQETLLFTCFSCGQAGSVIKMLADLNGVSHATAWRWLCERWAPHSVGSAELRHLLNRLLAQQDEQPAPRQVLGEDELERRRVDWYEVERRMGNFPPALTYLLRRGLSPDVLTAAECCYDEHSDRPCITVRDEDGALVGFKGRAWREDQQPRFLIIGDTARSLYSRGTVYGFSPYDASQYVYGLHDAVPDDGNLVVCEGELNVVALREMGLANTIAPSGSTLSERQVSLVAERAESVTVYFDYDLPEDAEDPRQQSKADTALLKIKTVVAMFEPYLPVFVVPEHRRDPADTASRREVLELLSAARSSLEMRLDLVSG